MIMAKMLLLSNHEMIEKIVVLFFLGGITGISLTCKDYSGKLRPV